ncbi:FliH/SctL family protein [Sinanaerobacter sp. ZZT-01]|uniref:FliH/SctL family protein n=1 Tax=Sinanaerobacter sp. ZZT-01 TaxID=3111540 RepID=UPI002D7841B2|nr:FliH/SctL family protein [Sinanaerobacter sp. ZZT-01]WRR93607.1 FliH/SctL family protein [Sinanaerobacter sp. ZZT-01]
MEEETLTDEPKECEDTDSSDEEANKGTLEKEETRAKEKTEQIDGQADMKAWLEEASKNVPQEMIEQAKQEADEIMRKAAMDASEVMNAGRQRATELQEESKAQGYQAGYDAGRKEALQKAEEEYKEELRQKYIALLEGAYAASLQIDEKKKEMQQQYLEQMKEMVLTIAEKVINVSLKSSAEVVERMILYALETSGSYQWAKVRIAAEDASRMQEAGVDLESALKHVADRVKIVVIDDAPSGTCYVEFPDQIIDASVQSQLQNIRTLTAI